MARTFWFLLALWLCAGSSSAQPPRPKAREMRVATRVVPPFVMRGKDGALTGFSVELWRAIERDTGLKSR